MKFHYHGVIADDVQRNGWITEEIARIRYALSNNADTPYAALRTPVDLLAFNTAQKYAQQILALQPTLFILVGIGGSNMGTAACVQALRGHYFNEINTGIKFYCAETIDNDTQVALFELAQNELVKGGTVVMCVVTKSGTTVETIINAALFLDLLKQYRPHDYQKYMVVITDTNSPLYHAAEDKGFTLIPLQKEVGGRFSIFSAVGLFPLAVVGFDISAFCQGAADMLEACLKTDFNHNPAAVSARLLIPIISKAIKYILFLYFHPTCSCLEIGISSLLGKV